MNLELTETEERLVRHAQQQAEAASQLLKLPVSREHVEQARRLLSGACGKALTIEACAAGVPMPRVSRE